MRLLNTALKRRLLKQWGCGSMKVYWKVKTSHERKDSDMASLYGSASRFFVTAAEAERRCQELNEADNQVEWLRGTFVFEQRFVRGGVAEDADAQWLVEQLA